MISLIFIFVASTLSALVGRLDADPFHLSIFRSLNPCFWNRRVSPGCTEKIFGYPLDAWFILQAAKVVAVCLAVVCYSPIVNPILDFVIYFGTWLFNFDIFFGSIFYYRSPLAKLFQSKKAKHKRS